MELILAKLHEATLALRDATERLTQERRARRRWVVISAAAILVLSVLVLVAWNNSQDIADQAEQQREQAERQQIFQCESRNDTRLAIRDVLELLVGQRDDNRSPEQQVEFDRLLQKLDTGVLEIQTCDA